MKENLSSFLAEKFFSRYEGKVYRGFLRFGIEKLLHYLRKRNQSKINVFGKRKLVM